NEYQLTKNLVEKMEGFPESIKYLKKNNQSFKDTPLLSDIINCDEKYKVSIENYLEPFLNHFIVERTDDAWKGLDLLHSEGKGRAHFFILDSLQKFNHSSPHEIEGCIPAINVVEPHHTYQPLLNYLLADVYVLRDDSLFQQLNSENINGAVILSVSGKFNRNSYSISGGSVGSYDGKRTGRLKHLEKLASEIQMHQSEVEKT